MLPKSLGIKSHPPIEPEFWSRPMHHTGHLYESSATQLNMKRRAITRVRAEVLSATQGSDPLCFPAQLSKISREAFLESWSLTKLGREDEKLAEFRLHSPTTLSVGSEPTCTLWLRPFHGSFCKYPSSPKLCPYLSYF